MKCIKKAARNTVKSDLRKEKYNFEKDLASKIKTENKLFWSYVRSKMKTRSSLGELELTNGNLTSDSHEKANVLNSFFSSVFENEGTGELPDFTDQPFAEPLCSTDISIDKISKTKDKIKATKSKGPDNIHPKLVKKCRKSMLLPLQLTFTKSLNEGKIPDVGKLATSQPYTKMEQEQKQKAIGQ